jgi:hypothetical protein
LDTPFTGSLGLALAACGVIGYLRKDLAAGISVFGLWIILAFCSLVIFWWPLFEINPAEKLTRELLLRSAGRSIASLQIPPATSSQIRLLSGGQLNPQSFASTKDLPADSVVIFTEQSRETFATGTYEIVPAGYLAKASKPKEMWRALRSGEVRGKAQNYYVAVPFSAKAQ